MSLESPVASTFRISEGYPVAFTVIYNKMVKNAREKYDQIKRLLQEHHINNGFYSLSAADEKIALLFGLMDSSLFLAERCSCKKRMFQIGGINSRNNYVSFGKSDGMKVKTLAYDIMNNTQGLRNIIISEETPDQKLRHYAYAILRNKLISVNPPMSILNQSEVKGKAAEEEAAEAEDEEADEDESESESKSEAEEEETAEYDVEAEDELSEFAEDNYYRDSYYDNVEVAEDNVRGDDPGDVTNCLNTGDVIYHIVNRDTWSGYYDEHSNVIITNSAYSQGNEVCPIQDFAVAHLKFLNLPHDDNSWTQCLVQKKNETEPTAIRVLVKKHFSLNYI
jgi:hypothetical protein